MKRFLWPLGVFVVIVVFLALGLGRDPREVPSPLVGKRAPDFSLPVLQDSAKRFAPAEMRGKVWMLNVWASWCAPCREEHPLLVSLAERKVLPILGLNYKDKGDDARAWLKRYGDPYLTTVADVEGRIAIDYGVYGVPETYVIDRDGVIRYKRVGPLTPEIVEGKILPLVKSLQ
jgi:cytochrome c biogenesis protein CcmG/thiol:disulfide interchange protein DsbE